jgi:hypothetical protein
MVGLPSGLCVLAERLSALHRPAQWQWQWQGGDGEARAVQMPTAVLVPPWS